MEKYQALFEGLGYKVWMNPFCFLGLGLIAEQKEAEKEHKDALYFQKNKIVGYDIAITNVLGKVMIVLLNPELVKELLSADTNIKFPKLQLVIQGVR